MRTQPRFPLARLACAVIIAAAGVCAACEEPPPTAPAPPTRPSPAIIDGSWAGTLTDVAAGAGELQMTTSGFDTTTSGSFTLRLDRRSAPLRGGIVGNVRGPADIVLFMSLEPAAPDCAEAGSVYIAELALQGNRLTGTFGPITPCPLLRSGTIELVRR